MSLDKPDLSLLLPYNDLDQATRALPRGPYATKFTNGTKTLFYVAAWHQSGRDTPTNQIISHIMDNHPVDAVILEPLPADITPDKTRQWARAAAARNFVGASEGAWAAHLATEKNIACVPGMPPQNKIKDTFNQQGYTDREIVFFNTCLMLDQYTRHHTHLDDVEAHVKTVLANEARQLKMIYPPSLSQFKNWYRDHMDVGFSMEHLADLHFQPRRGGDTTVLDRMHATFSDAREPNIIHQIATQLDRHDNVMIVHGSNHFAYQQAVLTGMFGNKPSFDV